MQVERNPSIIVQLLRGRIPLPRSFRAGWVPVVAALVLVAIILSALMAPWLSMHDPVTMNAAHRLKGPGADHLLGTDAYGRDLYARVITGGRVSLLVGIGTAIVSIALGLLVGLISGFFRAADAVIMRFMDALMAIPAILLAIALVALNGPSIWSVIFAITIPEMPRVVRVVRAVVLSAREEPYVEAAVALGSSMPKILFGHLMPNTFAPLIVQGTYICAFAIMTEAYLSFLGVGISAEIPTWGNIMAEGRRFFMVSPGIIFWPALMLSLCILAVNLLGDTARDMLDPRLKTRNS